MLNIKLTFVKVPVLSEHITETEPRVSTVLRDLHKILFFRMMLAVIVRLAVTAIGNPSGMNAMATLTQLTMSAGTEIQPGWFLRRYAALIKLVEDYHRGLAETNQTIMKRTIIVTMMEIMTKTKLRTSFSKGVIPVEGSLVSFAIRPKTVLSPVLTTTPRPLPAMQ